MRDIEAKLRTGMTRNGISHEAQEQIILSITSFALYGFPESHAASFALNRLCQRLFEVPLSRRIYRRSAQQPTHGFLFSGHAYHGCEAARIKNIASGCDEVEMDVYAGSSIQYQVPSTE